MKPPKQLDIPEDETFEHLEPLYGIAESGGHWCRTIIRRFLEELKLMRGKDDLSLIYNKIKNKLVGINGQYRD